MNARSPSLEFTDDLLREWGRYFRDRRQFERCKSIEGRFRAMPEDYEREGWGEPGAPVVVPPINVLRVLKTHEAVMETPKLQRWCITYAYAYPGLPRFVVLRCMRKWTGRRLNWKTYMEALDVGRFRVHCTISRASA